MRFLTLPQQFQSTFPRGERRYFVDPLLSTIRFQSTFPRGERRIIHVVLNTIYYISIHVPAWGTTVLCGLTGGKVGFQSTFPRGERRDSVTCHPLNIAISIHVPAWGTTQKLSGVEFDYTKFQSTFPRGERPWSQKVLLIFW